MVFLWTLSMRWLEHNLLDIPVSREGFLSRARIPGGGGGGGGGGHVHQRNSPESARKIL